MLGSGTYGSVISKCVAVKNYKKNPFFIARDVIREASILHHLNDSGVTSVPKIYHNSPTSMMMDMGGKSLRDHLIDIPVQSERCNFIEKHLDNIIAAIDQIHQAGVIHNDMTVVNVLIDEDGKVTIIDFGISTFGDCNYTDDIITNLNAASSYDISTNNPMFESPESYHYNRTLYSTDYWMLAAWIINLCCNGTYIPTNPDNDKWERIANILEESYTDIQITNHHRIRSSIMIPDIITPSLAARLRPMLEYCYLDRKIGNTSMTHQSIPPSLSTIRLGLDSSNIQSATAIIRETMRSMLRFGYHQNYGIGIAIDVIRRIFHRLNSDLTNNVRATALAINLIINSDMFIDEDIRQLEILLNEVNTTKDEVHKLEVMILDIIGWRVYTRTNVQLCDVKIRVITLYTKILRDDRVYNLMVMSDRALREYLIDV